MKEKRYLTEFEFESITCLPDGVSDLVLNHPNKTYEITLSNKSVEIGAENTVLTTLIVFPAPSLDEAIELGESYAREFSDFLTFSTGVYFKAGHLLKVADWSKGLEERECYLFSKFPGDDRPYPILDENVFSTIETFLEAEASSILKRSIRWFSRGVSSKYMDDQFQCFWFSIELLSAVYKSSSKVKDACAKCRKPLYCEHCNDYPEHKPYPKQAIEHLFQLMIKEDSGEFFNTVNGIRNSLMHGDDMKLIEKNKKIDFSEYVDKLARFTRIAIFNTIMNSYKEKKSVKINLIDVSTYCLQTLSVQSHIGFRSMDPDNPKFSDIPNINVEAVYEPKQKI